jgi:hypothetical protein
MEFSGATNFGCCISVFAARQLLQHDENIVAPARGSRGNPKERQIPPAKTACGMTIGAFL